MHLLRTQDSRGLTEMSERYIRRELVPCAPRPKAYLRILAATLVVIFGFCHGHVLAQTAGELAPETFQPANQRPVSPIRLSGEVGSPAPAGAESLFVQIGDIEIKDALPQMAAAHQEIRERLVGRRVSAAEVFAAAARLEADYAKAGFVLSRIVLPPQTLRDGGTLQLVVVNGFVERIDTSNVPEPVRERIERLTDPLVGKPGVPLKEIERQLWLAGDTYGVALGSALSAGATPGGTVVVLEPEYKRVTGFVGLDNPVADDLGKAILNTGIELNGLLSMGETFYGRFSTAPRDVFKSRPQYRTIAAGFVFPLGTDGWTFNLEAMSSKTTPTDQFVPNASDYERLSLRFFYPWIRSSVLNVSTQFTFDRIGDQQSLLAGGGEIPIYQDEMSVLRASADVLYQAENGGVLEGGLILSQGLDAFGARRPPTGGLPLSRAGADAVFTKLVMSARYRVPLSEQFALSLNARAQSSFGDPLLSSEQFNVAGTRELSTFDAGTVRGDNGWVARAEVSMPIQGAMGGIPTLFSPYIFGAYGQVNLEQPTVLEQSTVKASSYGIGVDITSLLENRFQSGSLRVEYGRGNRDDLRPDGNRFSFVGTYRF